MELIAFVVAGCAVKIDARTRTTETRLQSVQCVAEKSDFYVCLHSIKPCSLAPVREARQHRLVAISTVDPAVAIVI